MALILNTRLYDKLQEKMLPDSVRKTGPGFIKALSEATGIKPSALRQMRAKFDYGCTPKGQKNIAAVNKAMREMA